MRESRSSALLGLGMSLLLAACGADASISSGSGVVAGESAQDLATPDAGGPETQPTASSSELATVDPAATVTDMAGDERYLALTAYGFDTDERGVEFGLDPETTLDVLTSYLGEPDFDGGWVGAFDGGCVGVGADEVRNVGWGSTNVLFLGGTDDAGGAPHFAYWFTNDPDQAVLSFVGDASEITLRAGSSTAGDLRAHVPADAIEVVDEPPLGPYFYAQDNWGELRGELTDTTEEALVQSVNAGVLCGE